MFASVAFYLQQHGWTDGQMWGREVKIPAAARARAAARAAARDRVPRRADDDGPAPLRDLAAHGAADRRRRCVAVEHDVTASLVQSGSRSFLLYENYDALLGYNCAHTYALSVALLAERLK